MYRTYSKPLLGGTIAPNLVPGVLKKIFSLEMVKNRICLGRGVQANKMPFFQNMCPKKTKP